MTESKAQHISSLRIAPLQRADLAQSARMHRMLLPHGLFPRLGYRFMRRWHRTFVDSPHGVALGAVDEQGNMHGFLLATTDQVMYTRSVLASARRALAWRGALALAMRPAVAAQFMRTRSVRYLKRLLPARSQDLVASTPAAAQVGVLHAVAALPAARGQGVGAALLGEYVRFAAAGGTPLMQLITRDTNGAADFYRGHGWVITDRRLDRDGHAVVQLDYVPGEA